MVGDIHMTFTSRFGVVSLPWQNNASSWGKLAIITYTRSTTGFFRLELDNVRDPKALGNFKLPLSTLWRTAC